MRSLELNTRAALSSAGQGNHVPTYLLIIVCEMIIQTNVFVLRLVV